MTCVCLARGEVSGVRGLCLGYTNPGGTGGKWDMCLCFGCGSVGGVGGEWVGGLGQGLGCWGGVSLIFYSMYCESLFLVWYFSNIL